MRLSLSTNWCNRGGNCSGEEIVESALSLGIGEIELGYNTTDSQVPGLKRRRGEIVVGSVHAFAPVPISAPSGCPELYQLASFDPAARTLALLHVLKNIEFAAEMGARTLVLHAGRVSACSLFRRRSAAMRTRRGRKMLDVLKGEIGRIVPVLEESGVALALENMPYIEGFPNLAELKNLTEEFKGAPVKGWLDTGHYHLGSLQGWEKMPLDECDGLFAGMHINDVVDGDDHLAPGEGNVDFKSISSLARRVGHLVLEPSPAVSRERLEQGIKHIKEVWQI